MEHTMDPRIAHETPPPCPVCSHDPTRAAIDSLVDALAVDDLERAITLGLLDARPEDTVGLCIGCMARGQIVIAARDARLRAFAARERYRARQVRLAERADIRARKRTNSPSLQSAAAVSIPPAAAAALARAKARVAAKPQQE
jgi:hypothetical protein